VGFNASDLQRILKGTALGRLTHWDRTLNSSGHPTRVTSRPECGKSRYSYQRTFASITRTTQGWGRRVQAAQRQILHDREDGWSPGGWRRRPAPGSVVAWRSGSQAGRPRITPKGLAIVGLDTRKPRRNLVLLEPAIAHSRRRAR